MLSDFLFISAASASSTIDTTLGGLDNTAGHIGFTKRNLFGLLSGLAKWAFTFLAIIFLVLIIFGGFLWMTARGNDDQVKKAQHLIKAAVSGLIIISAAYAITAFLGDFTLSF